MPRKITANDVMVTRDLMDRRIVMEITLPNGDMVQDDIHAARDMVPDIMARTGQDITDLLAAAIANSSYPIPDGVLDWAESITKRLVGVTPIPDRALGYRYRADLADGSYYLTDVREARFAPFLDAELASRVERYEPALLQAAE